MKILYIRYRDSNWPDYFKPYVAVGYVRGIGVSGIALYFTISLEEWLNQGGE